MKRWLVSFILILAYAHVFYGHDLFLKAESFFLPAQQQVSIALLNGTFAKSENTIARDRMIDVSIVGPSSERVHPDTSQWRNVGAETLLDFKTGISGTYVVGVSTAPRIIELSATDFNEYLEHDGVLDILADRKQQDKLNEDARERYAKHVKAVLQVGDTRSDAFRTRLGYPVELVPLQNPYALQKGDTLSVLFLRDGKPGAHQLIYASYEGFHRHEDGSHREAIQTRTDADGVAAITLAANGRWYVRLINMQEIDEEDVDYESNWATLTFEIR